MRFRLWLLGTEIFCMDFIFPSRGIYEIPEEIFSEAELDEMEAYFSSQEEEDGEA